MNDSFTQVSNWQRSAQHEHVENCRSERAHQQASRIDPLAPVEIQTAQALHPLFEEILRPLMPEKTESTNHD